MRRQRAGRPCDVDRNAAGRLRRGQGIIRLGDPMADPVLEEDVDILRWRADRTRCALPGTGGGVTTGACVPHATAADHGAHPAARSRLMRFAPPSLACPRRSRHGAALPSLRTSRRSTVAPSRAGGQRSAPMRCILGAPIQYSRAPREATEGTLPRGRRGADPRLCLIDPRGGSVGAPCRAQLQHLLRVGAHARADLPLTGRCGFCHSSMAAR